jgi:hypothetical protein
LPKTYYLVRRMAREGRIAMAPVAAVTSGRRWQQSGTTANHDHQFHHRRRLSGRGVTPHDWRRFIVCRKGRPSHEKTDATSKKRNPAEPQKTGRGSVPWWPMKPGEIFDLEGFAAVGADGTILSPMTTGDTIELPHGSELMFLPDRIPVVMDLETGQTRPLDRNPYSPEERIFPVAALTPPVWC